MDENIKNNPKDKHEENKVCKDERCCHDKSHKHNHECECTHNDSDNPNDAHGCGCEHGHSHKHTHGCGCGGRSIPKWLDTIFIIAGFVAAIAGFVLLTKGVESYPSFMFIVAYLLFGINVFFGLFRQLARGSFFSENMLMTVASVGAVAISETMEGMLVMMLFRIGEMLEHYAESRAEKSIDDLLKLKPKTVRVLQPDGSFKLSKPENLSIGDVITVKPGEVIGADGTVARGTGEVDTSSITGESLPVAVKQGSAVLFGYCALNAPLEIEVTEAYQDGTFAKIVTALKENLDKKSKSETFIAKFAKIYTPCVMLLALAVFLLGSVITGEFSSWLYRALVFLAVSCPCALVISVPLTFFVGLGFLSKKGLLLKGSGYIEKLAKCALCVFDKTGTLTSGELSVTGIEACEGYDVGTVMTIAYALEKASSHPVARAICAEAEKYALGKCDVSDWEEMPGKGMYALCNGEAVYCGNEEVLKLANIESAFPDDTFSGVYIAKENTPIGRIFLSDSIREASSSTFSSLKAMGVKTAILTGDRGASVENCIKALSPDYIAAGLLPSEKSEEMESLLGRFGKDGSVVYLGDGINDAPVIARADVGIAMGIGGADVTVESADGILMNSHLRVLVEAIDMSKAIVRRAKSNIVIAFAVKLLVLILGAMGYASMLAAMLADVGVLVVVVINSLRRYKR